MDIQLKPVTRDDLQPLFKMKVAPEQENFVAPNEFSLAQVHYETGATPYVIWDDDVRVGFCQVIDVREQEDPDEEDHPEGMYLWRLLIPVDQQRKGYGQAAVRQLIEMARAAGNRVVQVSCVPENAGAMTLYEGLGFRKTGVVVDGEVQLQLDL